MVATTRVDGRPASETVRRPSRFIAVAVVVGMRDGGDADSM